MLNDTKNYFFKELHVTMHYFSYERRLHFLQIDITLSRLDDELLNDCDRNYVTFFKQIFKKYGLRKKINITP